MNIAPSAAASRWCVSMMTYLPIALGNVGQKLRAIDRIGPRLDLSERERPARHAVVARTSAISFRGAQGGLERPDADLGLLLESAQ